MRIFICGISGRMGSALCAEAIACGHSVAGGIDEKPNMFPVFLTADKVRCNFDAIIDFSSPSLLPETMKLIAQTRRPAVICTTGLSDDDCDALRGLAAYSPVFRSGNVSRGIGVASLLVRVAAEKLRDFDAEIVETHHRTKADAPSGTAKLLAGEIVKARHDLTPVFNRDGKRKPNEIGIASVRGGTICGEHEVVFAGDDETLIIRHVACSRRVFARGALDAAEFLLTKKTGLYSLDDLYSDNTTVKNAP